jgi:phosphate transport system substrate-binding protein
VLAGVALAACGSDSSTSSTAGGASSSSSSSATAKTYTCQAGAATAHGSTALQPLAQKAATQYQAKCPGSTITVSGGGSSEGISKAVDGSFDIGDSDVPASAAKNVDTSSLVDHRVAIVVFAIVVNPKANVTNLTLQQVKDVFAGNVTSWKQVGGADVPVTLIFRKAGSGTRLSFQKDIMGSTKESTSPAREEDSTQNVLTAVADPGNAGAVSYINVASATPAVTTLSIDNAKPTADDVKSGKYIFFAHEHMFTKGPGSAIARSFIDFILSDDFQKTEVPASGFIPVATTDKQAAVDV